MKFVYSLLLACAFIEINTNALDLRGSILLGGLRNVTTTATNYLSGALERQKELFGHVTDTATGYVSSAMEQPRNMLNRVKNVTTDYIDRAASGGLQYKLNLILEKLRTKMPYGMPIIDVPVLEPLRIDHQDFNVHNKEVGDITGFVQDLTIHNLTTFVVQLSSMTLAGPTIVINMTIPTIYATGYYNVSGLLGGMMPLHGAGPFQARIYGLRCYVKTVLGYSGGMYMKSFDLDFSIDSLSLNMENLMKEKESSDIMNRVLGELAPKALEEIKPDVLPQIQEYIANRANATMYHLTTADVISILMGKVDF